jgi:hypothetical protein
MQLSARPTLADPPTEGRRVSTKVSFRPLFGLDDRYIGAIGIMTDLTDEKLAQTAWAHTTVPTG